MCGRARCTLRVDAVPAACGIQAPLRSIDSERYRPSYNVAPGAYMPVIRNENKGEVKEAVVHCMKWGLVPSFTKKSQKPDHYRMFNARSESVHQKSSFRRLLSKSRCLAAVEGFYEWKKDGGKKQPYYVHLKDSRPLVFAALYDSWENAEGEVVYTFTILTTRVCEGLEWLHDRMPVVLGSQDAIQRWLNDDLSEANLHNLTQPYEYPDLVSYPVTPAMGKPAFNGPECVEELKLKVASVNTIAQLFSKKKAVETSIQNTNSCSKTTHSQGGGSERRSMDEEGQVLLDEEEQKALIAGMEPDQDVTETLQTQLDEKSEGVSLPPHSEHAGEFQGMQLNSTTKGGRDELSVVEKGDREVSPHLEGKGGIVQGASPKSEKSLTRSPLAPKRMIESEVAKDSKRRQLTRSPKGTGKNTVSEKQSNLFAFLQNSSGRLSPILDKR